MSKLKTYNEFVNESIIDAVKNPIKWKKIKNNAKKFQKAKVAHALNDVDYAKKKASSDSKKETEILKITNNVKNAALKDVQSNISSRMDDLATTTGLKAVVRLAKTKSSLAANKIVIKAATGEQAKQLKIRQKKLTKQASEAERALKDYETTNKKEPVKDKSEMDKLAARNEVKKREKAEKEAKEKANKEAKEKESTDEKNTKDGMLKRAQDQLTKAKESGDEEKIKKAQDLIDKISQKESWELQDTDLSVIFESELNELEKFVNAYVPLVESISDKFKRLRPNLS
jgi:hypothetical protein